MRVLIIGVGNRLRRDDGFGPIVAERLAQSGLPTREHSGEGAGLMDLFADLDCLILVDAAKSGARAGTIHRLNASSTPLPKGFFHYSTHLFGPAEAVEMARMLNRLPPQVHIFAVEGKDFAHGEGLSPSVERGAKTVEREIRALFAKIIPPR